MSYASSRPLLSFVPDDNSNTNTAPTRVDPDCSGLGEVRLFTIPNLLSVKECEAIMQDTSSHMQPVDWEYVKEYRSCKRAVMMSTSLAKTIEERLMCLWTRGDLEDVRPFGFGTDGVWVLPRELRAVNECMRVSAYEVNQRFAPHRDSGFVVTDDYRSVYTLLIYLNETFAGGETVFYPPRDSESCAPLTVKPKQGMAVVFTHDLRHEGCAILHGTKYVLRTDVMFQRVSMSSMRATDNDDQFLLADKLYKKSIELQLQGKPDLSTKAFVKAVEIHSKQQSVQRRTPPTDEAFRTRLSKDAWLRVGIHLSLPDIASCMLINSYFRSVFRQPQLWLQLYQRRWPSLIPHAVRSVSKSLEEKESQYDKLTDYWMTSYQYRVSITMLRVLYALLTVL
jgi:hypothetical protein